MNPRTEKTTNPARKLVAPLSRQIQKQSLEDKRRHHTLVRNCQKLPKALGINICFTLTCNSCCCVCCSCPGQLVSLYSGCRKSISEILLRATPVTSEGQIVYVIPEQSYQFKLATCYIISPLDVAVLHYMYNKTNRPTSLHVLNDLWCSVEPHKDIMDIT